MGIFQRPPLGDQSAIGSGDLKKKASGFLKKKLLKKGSGAVGNSRYEKEGTHQDMVQQRIEEYKKKMMAEATGRKEVHLPGTDPNQTRELSKSAKEALEKMAERKAQKEERKKMMKTKAREISSGKDGKGPAKKKPLFLSDLSNNDPFKR